MPLTKQLYEICATYCQYFIKIKTVLKTSKSNFKNEKAQDNKFC